MRELRLRFCNRLESFISIVQEIGFIRRLDLERSGIKELHSWIGYCTSLEVLNLTETPIKHLPSSIGDLTSLEHLKASGTLIEELPPSIGNLSLLRTLWLCRTPLKGLPSSIGCLTSLEILELSNTLIEELPSSIGCLTSLEILELSNTLIEELPPSIGCLTSLEVLVVSYTLIEELPSSVGCLTSLEILDVSNTFIEELPHSIGDCTCLRELKVSTTPIRELPSSIGNLNSLSELNVSKTLIKELPSTIGCLTFLLELDASETLIEELPLSIGDLICLKRLKLKGCANLTTLPHSVYGGLQKLNELDLSWCRKLVTFPIRPSAFVSSSAESLPPKLPTNSNNGNDDCGPLLFPCLRRLRLCPLSIPNFLPNLDCVTTLLTLDLSGSSFDSLPACISNFSRLEYLDLGGCKNLRDISKLPANLRGINLDGCVSLERLSRLSNMFEQKDTVGYLRWMNLSNCHRPVDNLGMNIVSKMAKALLDKLLSDGLPNYWNIILPKLWEIEVPEWFDSGKLDITVLRGTGELVIKILRTLKGKRTGLLVCAVFDITQNFFGGFGCRTPVFEINKVPHIGRCTYCDGSKGRKLSADDDNVYVCLACIDFKVVDHEVPVIFEFIKFMSGRQRQWFSLKSFGIHHLANMQQTNAMKGKRLGTRNISAEQC